MECGVFFHIRSIKSRIFLFKIAIRYCSRMFSAQPWPSEPAPVLAVVQLDIRVDTRPVFRQIIARARDRDYYSVKIEVRHARRPLSLRSKVYFRARNSPNLFSYHGCCSPASPLFPHLWRSRVRERIERTTGRLQKESSSRARNPISHLLFLADLSYKWIKLAFGVGVKRNMARVLARVDRRRESTRSVLR